MKTIAIPIETKVREFDGKLWLGLNLIQRGHQVILGSSSEIKNSLHITEPDIYITKDIGDSGIEFVDNLRAAGIIVCGLNTEGAVFESMDRYASNKHEILSHLDALFSWGAIPAESISQHYNDASNVYVTGNPRFDLLQPHLRFIYQNRSMSLNEKYGNYILFNGNFTLANPFSDRQIEKEEELFGSIEADKQTYQNRIFYSFIEAVFHLQSEFPETSVIIRPHPSEDNTTYEKAFRGYDRVYVEDSGDVRTWIAGACATVHHDCTTGIESALMGVPAVSYRPVQNESYESKLPQCVSNQVFTQTDLVEYISHCLSSDQTYELDADQTNHLKQYFHNTDESAAENICDVIKGLETATEKNYGPLMPDLGRNIEQRVKCSRWSDQAIKVYDGVQRLIGDESPQKQRQYRKQKFPGIKKEEILQLIQQIKQELNINSVSVEEVSMTNDTFYIRSK